MKDHPRVEDRAATTQTKILLIEDSIADAQLLRLLLRADPRIAVTTATRLAKGITLLGREPFDLVLLDLSLPDGEGVDAVCRVNRAARDVPIIGLSSVHDEELEIQALREGAQDWLVKGEIDRSLLMRVIRYACERHRLTAALQSLALIAIEMRKSNRLRLGHSISSKKLRPASLS